MARLWISEETQEDGECPSRSLKIWKPSFSTLPMAMWSSRVGYSDRKYFLHQASHVSPASGGMEASGKVNFDRRTRSCCKGDVETKGETALALVMEKFLKKQA